eukprot:gb/GECG01003130.1/.p1 GENE.gb/GECG01003130.1/~~gb/GECG01003130.1/.p1  ORF type:complete len:130 (+),score=6.55 gb/GECG01003130.1/:1-390(+)
MVLTSTSRQRSFVVTVFLLALIVVEWGFVLKAGMKPPPDDDDFVRRDCYLSAKGGKEPNTERDCGNHQGPFCTKSQPCTPCTDTTAEIPCRTCQREEDKICQFVPTVGPYCRVGQNKVEPCTQCCAEAR